MQTEEIQARINAIRFEQSKGNNDLTLQLSEGLSKQFIRDIASGECDGKEVLYGAKMIGDLLNHLEGKPQRYT